MNTDDLFEFDAPKTFVNLYEIANANYDGADRIFGKSGRAHIKRDLVKSYSPEEGISFFVIVPN